MPTKRRRVYYDVKVYEDGTIIAPISIGMCDADGREFYAVNRYAPWHQIATDPTLMATVVPQLPRATDRNETYVGPCKLDFAAAVFLDGNSIADHVTQFLFDHGPDVELWSRNAALGHVALTWLWPWHRRPSIPSFTNDLEQERHRRSAPMPHLPADEQHHALRAARLYRTCHHSFTDVDMPVFTIKGTDALALATIEGYAEECTKAGLHEQATEVDKAFTEIRNWQARNPTKVKLPDHTHVPVTG